jgi:predicted SAM-dependent methyltransferase
MDNNIKKKSSEDKLLNLGCGTDIRKGWENMDKNPVDERVKYIDLDKLPLDLPSNCYSYILLSHVYEHLSVNKMEFMQEINRILKPGGKVRITVPVFHQTVEHETTFFTKDYFNSMTSKYYGKLFKKVKVSFVLNTFKTMLWKVGCFIRYLIEREVTYDLTK